MEVRMVASGRLGRNFSDPWDCNAYLVMAGGDAVLVDTGAGRDSAALLAQVGDALGSHRLTACVLTHGHVDHSGGAQAVSEFFDVPVYAHHAACAALRAGDERRTGLQWARARGIYPSDQTLTPVIRARSFPAEGLRVGPHLLEGFPTAGHSYDHMVYSVRENDRLDLFTGDLVFAAGRVATSELPDCDPARIASSLRHLTSCGPERMFPGHGEVVESGATLHLAHAVHEYDRDRAPEEIS